MRVIPVLDLMGGHVVRGIGGRRHEYRPIESRLCASSRPAEVASALREHFGFDVAYVADLDAIAGGEPVWAIYEEVAAQGLALWVDAGVSNIERAQALAEFSHSAKPLAGIVAGLESISGPELLGRMLSLLGCERLIFSLDLRGGSPLTASAGTHVDRGPCTVDRGGHGGSISQAIPRDWHGLSADAIVQDVLGLGLRRLIVLDLARVGEGQGVGTESLCRRIRDRDSDLELTAGGGVRGPHDLRSLQAAGCNVALVASALHDGRLTRQNFV